MAKNLIIVESPAKAKTLSRFLSKDYIVKASLGHIRDLPVKTFGVDTEDNFKPSYVIDSQKKKIIAELKKAANETEVTYLAPDHDREGEAIAWHLAEVLKKETADKPLHRITFNEITQNAILKALQEPGSIDMNKVNSQQARRILDRIVGYNISPLLWKVIAKNLSAGRVQSVALRLICEREDLIRSFKPEEYWNIEAQLYKGDLPSFKAVLQKWQGKNLKLSSAEEADKIYNALEKAEYKITEIKDSNKKIQPSPPYITSSLQQDAARLLNYSAKKTMMIAQQLYEGIDLNGETVGLITYMRTDSLRISEEALNVARNLIKERYGNEDLNPKTRVFKNKNRAQDAHEAVRPTDSFKTPEYVAPYLSEDQLKLYTLIWQRFIATQMLPISLQSRNLKISAAAGTFTASGSIISNKGFSKAYPHTILMLGEKIHQDYTENLTLALQKLDALQKFTKPPARYTEAALIKELESNGVGRPSTYATITNTIRVRKYVVMKQKRFFPTELGLQVNKFVVSNFEEFFNVKFTAEMEDTLDEVEYGKIFWQDPLQEYYSSLKNSINKIDIRKAKKDMTEITDIKCEKCDSNMIIKWGPSGQFLACSNFPKCKNIKNFERLEDGSIKIKEPEKTDEKCPKCNHNLIVKSGRYGKFLACSNYPKCKFTKPLTLGIKCPECNTGEIVEKKNKKGKTFYSCSNYPECKFISNYKPEMVKCDKCGTEFLQLKKKDNCPVCEEE
ncbi:MAG: DNA topoisomerase I [Candidatus Cloacimonas sp. SDB]|nr:MAG: DNA topoisomerase I [Candidatus Cloacimonas sp. SDB]